MSEPNDLTVVNMDHALPMRWRLFWLAVLTPHAMAAIAALALSPRGFPVSHPQFWVTQIIPILTLALVVIAQFAIQRRRSWMHLPLACFPAAWIAAAVAARTAFPVSFRIFWLPVLAGGIVMALAVWRTWGGKKLLSIATIFITAVIGAAVPLLERSPPPSTIPLDIETPNFASDVELNTRLARFGEALSVQPSDGVVNLRVGNVAIAIQPLLSFISRSPDRCWTIFSPRALREGNRRELLAAHREPEIVQLQFKDDGLSWLSVDSSIDGLIDIESISKIDQPIDSHLNTFCEIGIYGHHKLALAFSPCGDARIEVQPMDYPVGRPQRSAYLDSDGMFHVVEAHSAEKGPFRELASGELSRGEALVITLFDGDQPICEFTFDDFASQASTALSPTAGWGYPCNAVEFCRYGESETAQAAITMTLSGTSVGRGYHSVGHAAGTYRNRFRIRPIARAK